MDLARLNPDGTLDADFDATASLAGALRMVSVVTLQSDGSILAGGSTFGMEAWSGIVRLDPDGARNSGFAIGSGANGTVNAIAVQPDGRLIVGGAFTSFNGLAANGIVRLNPEGSRDGRFDSGDGIGSSYADHQPSINAINIRPDGKLIVGGSFTTYNGAERANLARLNPDGSLDESFDSQGAAGTGQWEFVQDIAVQPDGMVLIGGYFWLNFNLPNIVIRLHGVARPAAEQAASPLTGLPDPLILVAAIDRDIVFFDVHNDTILRRFEIGRPNSIEILDNGNILISYAFLAREIDSHGNIIRDARPSEYGMVTDARKVDEQTVLMTDGQGKSVFEMDWDGTIGWKIEGMHFPSEAKRLEGGNTLVADGTGTLKEFNADGEMVWSARLSRWALSAERLPDGTTIVGESGNVELLDGAGRVVWQRSFGGRMNGVGQLPSGDLYATDGDNETFHVISRQGDLMWTLDAESMGGEDLHTVAYWPFQEK